MNTGAAVAFWVGLFFLGSGAMFLASRRGLIAGEVAGALWFSFLVALVVQLGRVEKPKAERIEPKSDLAFASKLLLWILAPAAVASAIVVLMMIALGE